MTSPLGMGLGGVHYRPRDLLLLMAALLDTRGRWATRGFVRNFAPGLNYRAIEVPLRLSDFRLIAFDMDSTLINIECIDEVADAAGRKAEVAAITEAVVAYIRVTASPIATTTPANSWPGTCGSVWMSESCPCHPCQSERHSPVATT